MATYDGAVIIDTRLETGGLQKSINQLPKTLKSATNGFSSLTSMAKKAAVAIGAAFSVKALVDFGTESVHLANTYEASMQQINRIMGENAASFSNWINQQAAAFNMSKRQAAQYGAVYGNLISSFEKDTGKISDYTTQLLQASSTIASATGRTMDDVMERIRSGLLGNTEAIEDLGVNVNVSMIESTKAFKKFAGDKSWQQLDFQTQQQIRLFAILEQSADKYGNSVIQNTATSLAGLSSQFDNLKTSVGQALQPLVNIAVPALSRLIQLLDSAAQKAAIFMQTFFGIKSSVSNTTDSVMDAADAEKELADSITEANKAAKKATIGIDELNIITTEQTASATNGGTSSGSPDISQGQVGESIIDTSGIEKAVKKIKELLEPLQKISFDNLRKSFDKLANSLKPFTKTIFSGLEWGYKKIFIPLSEFTIEEILPRFLDTLSVSVDLVGKIIEEHINNFKQFYNEFLKPIADFAAPKFLQFWDDFNAKFQALVNNIQGSEAFEDLRTVLSKIYSLLVPIIEKLITIGSWFSSFKLGDAFNKLEEKWRNLEDVIGMVAAILNGDFSDAWEHFQDLMVDNKIDTVKDKLSLLNEKFGEVKETVGGWVTHWKESIGDFVETWKQKITGWWDNNVAPWFTAEKWNGVLQGMVDGFANAWNSVVAFFTESVPAWWNKNIAPWFTAEKWAQLWEDVKEGVKKGWNAVVSFFTESIPNWWNQNIAPWFTKDKWVELLGGVKDAFSQVFNAIKNIVKIPLNAIIKFINKVIGGINSLSFDVPAIKFITDGFHVGFNIPKIPELATGAVIPPNKEFLAMLGDQRNGYNIETPESLLRQIVREESVAGDVIDILSQILAVLENQDKEVKLYVDNRAIAKASMSGQKSLGYSIGGV